MNDTFAGRATCTTDEHTKPFVIEWDATDMSSFESIAAHDVVFVKYEGCSLRVLDECKNDSIRGEQGAYRPVTWTTGQLETVDIHNTADLHTKLPLGKALLGARVSGGEQFHMEYFVAGTRYASRDAVYASDIEGRYGCEETTHFVYGYNLGAFTLGSTQARNIEAGASMYGVGAEGKRARNAAIEKRGGELSACFADSAQEVAGCQSPIRLQLRKIRPGHNPIIAALAAPPTPSSEHAVALMHQKLDIGSEAQARFEAATAKASAGDGAGCLQQLDLHDRLDPSHASTDPSTAGFSMIRAQCVMLSGACEAGKIQYRKALEHTVMANYGPEQIDRSVDHYAALYCRGQMSPTDGVRQALTELSQAAFMTKKSAKFCEERYARVKRLLPHAKPRDADDSEILNAERSLLVLVTSCFHRAGHCEKSWAAYQELAADTVRDVPPDLRKATLRSGFEGLATRCKAES